MFRILWEKRAGFGSRIHGVSVRDKRKTEE